jgi:hypothetical protein
MSKLGELIEVRNQKRPKAKGLNSMEKLRAQCKRLPAIKRKMFYEGVQLSPLAVENFTEGKKLPPEALDRITKWFWPNSQYVAWQDEIEKAPSTATPAWGPEGVPKPFPRRPDGVYPPGPMPDMKIGALTKPYKEGWEDDDDK